MGRGSRRYWQELIDMNCLEIHRCLEREVKPIGDEGTGEWKMESLQ